MSLSVYGFVVKMVNCLNLSNPVVLCERQQPKINHTMLYKRNKWRQI